MPTLQRCFKYRIRPTPEQEQQLRQWAGCRRLVWNYFLARRQDTYRETGKTLSLAAMCRELTLLKRHPDFVFLCECDSQALQQVLRDLHAAYLHFFEKRARFPKRKSRKKTANAFRIPQRVKPPEGGLVSLPKVGAVRILLHRPLEGVVKSATVKQEPSGKWTITFVTHFEAPAVATSPPQSPVGLDAGLESFVTTSEDEKTPPPRFYRKQERKLKQAQRRHSRKQKGSKNKAKARKQVAVVQAQTCNRRNDWLHKLSRVLCEPKTISFIFGKLD